MCGYVSTGLRNAVVAARATRNAIASQEAGNFYGVGFVSKKGKVSPCSHANLPRTMAEQRVAYVQGLNPKSTVVLIDCRSNTIVA